MSAENLAALSPAAAATSSFLKSGMTLTQVSNIPIFSSRGIIMVMYCSVRESKKTSYNSILSLCSVNLDHVSIFLEYLDL